MPKSHWMWNTRFYHIYCWLNSRCKNTYAQWYMRYGWRWIKNTRKCFEEFYDDMYSSYIEHSKLYWESNTTIDRIDVDWDYCLSNCRWATYKLQSRNTSRNRIFDYNWKQLCIADISKETGINENTLRVRLYRKSKNILDDVWKLRPMQILWHQYCEKNSIQRNNKKEYHKFWKKNRF